MTSQNHYEVLGVSNDCSYDEIKTSFRKLALLYHPDKSDQNFVEEFHKIQEAWKILSNPQQRQEYNQKLNLKLQNLVISGNYSLSEFNEEEIEGEKIWSMPCRCGENYEVT